jgi:hypothetical protein
MGCDIHIHTEKLIEINGKNKWVNCDNWRYNEYYNPKNSDGEQKLNIHPIYLGRNYELFSILAGVRSNDDDPSKCISTPKGLPKNISKHTKAEAKRWEGDAHSHSYLTLKEIKDFHSKNSKVKFSGFISKENAKKLDEGTGTPDFWCGYANPELEFVHREWEEENMALNKLISAIDERMRDEFWIFGKEEYPEIEGKIRIVFWFDN